MTEPAPLPTPGAALRPLSAGEILDTAFGLYRRLFGPLVTIQLICSSVPFLLSMYVAALGPGPTSLMLTFFSYLLSFVLGSLAVAATAYVVSESYLGRTISAGDALRRAFPRTGEVIALSLLVGLVTGVSALPFSVVFMAGMYGLAGHTSKGFGAVLVLLSLVLLVLPVFVFSALALGVQVLVLEDLRNPLRALGRTWRLTRDARLRITGMLLVFVLLLLIPIVALAALAGVLLAALGTSGPDGSGGRVAEVVFAVIGALVGFLVTPAAYCLLTLLYYDLRVRKEGLDLELLAASLAGSRTPR